MTVTVSHGCKDTQRMMNNMGGGGGEADVKLKKIYGQSIIDDLNVASEKGKMLTKNRPAENHNNKEAQKNKIKFKSSKINQE